MKIIEFIKNNYDWLLSGLGTSVLFFILGAQYGYKKSNKQKQQIGNNSSAIQVGGDFNVEKANTKCRK